MNLFNDVSADDEVVLFFSFFSSISIMKRLYPAENEGLFREWEQFNVGFVEKRVLPPGCGSPSLIPVWNRFSVLERSSFLRSFFVTFYINQKVCGSIPFSFSPFFFFLFFYFPLSFLSARSAFFCTNTAITFFPPHVAVKALKHFIGRTHSLTVVTDMRFRIKPFKISFFFKLFF